MRRTRHKPDRAAERAARRAGAVVADLLRRKLAAQAPSVRRGELHDPPRPDGEAAR